MAHAAFIFEYSASTFALTLNYGDKLCDCKHHTFTSVSYFFIFPSVNLNMYLLTVCNHMDAVKCCDWHLDLPNILKSNKVKLLCTK